MAGQIIQASFNAGEWAPKLYARVDLGKYHSGAALLRNFFVDYRGGATACPGSKYIYPCLSGTARPRLIPFQASLLVSYIAVFENQKLYFISNGSPVLETANPITAITQANPGVITSNAHGYANGNRVFIQSVVGMTQINGTFGTVAGAAANTFTLLDIFGNPIDTTAYSAYVSGGTVSRVYTIASPYATADLPALKYAQDVNVMVLTHPNYPPYSLTLTSATSWALAAITIGSTVAAPVGQAVATTLGAGTWNYAYVITAVDASNQESGPSAFATLANVLDLRATAGTNTVTWTAVTGAASYNIYKAEQRSGAAVPAGSMFGFIGNCTGITFIDSNIDPDFSQGVPIIKNPFNGSGVQSVTVTAPGAYTTTTGGPFPTVSFVGGGGTGATGQVLMTCIAVAIVFGGSSYNIGDVLPLPGGVFIRVTSISGGKAITGLSITNPGSQSGNFPATNPVNATTGGAATFNMTFGVASVGITSPGTGYGPAPTPTFSSGTATATATLGSAPSGNPTVPCYHQQRLGLLGPVSSPSQVNFSQPGAVYNFNVTNPVAADNAFQGTLKSGQLNTIQSAVSQPQGLIVLSDKVAWLLNGGSPGSVFDATNLAANPQIFNGAAGLPPIVAVDDILYVQAKGSIVRDIIFNFSKQVYTGADISIQSSHLFYGFQLLEWAYAEEPFKLIWAVRNDGTLLCLTFLREQELVAWTHRDTQGAYKSIASVTENTPIGYADAVYTVVQRSVGGGASNMQYIERFQEQYYPTGATDSWQVDAGLQYNGVATTSFSGGVHLSSVACVGVATSDTGTFSTFSLTMGAQGTFTLPAPASPATGYIRVTIGLAYTPQLQTLQIDTGEPTIQGKMKKLPYVTVRVNETLGLQIGSDFDASNLVDMEDLIVGNVGKDTNEVVTDLVSGDALQTVDPAWTVPGQYCIQQSLPYPVTILGVIPAIELEAK